MKGIVFSEFLEMVDEKFGPDITEQMIARSELPSGGAYTSVGTYDHSEIIVLVSNLSRLCGLEAKTLVFTFGHYLVQRFETIFPQHFQNIDDATVLLERVNEHIHVEVRKLYDDAQLPQISTSREPDGAFLLNYRSARGMGDLAEGMISGAIEIFGSQYDCDRNDLKTEDGYQCIQFKIKAKSGMCKI